MPSSRGSSWPRDGTCVSYDSCIGRRVLARLGSPGVRIVTLFLNFFFLPHRIVFRVLVPWEWKPWDLTTGLPGKSLGFTLGVVHSVSLNKCVLTCVHHYSIIQNSFGTILATLWVTLRAFKAGGTGFTPGGGTKRLHALGHGRINWLHWLIWLV